MSKRLSKKNNLKKILVRINVLKESSTPYKENKYVWLVLFLFMALLVFEIITNSIFLGVGHYVRWHFLNRWYNVVSLKNF